MAIKDFQNLIEIQSLDMLIKKHLDAVAENNGRIDFIADERARRKCRLDECTAELKATISQIKALEKELSDVEIKIKKSNEHIAMAKTEREANAIQHELDELVPKSENLQDKILTCMDEQEKLEIELEAINKFLKGSEETLEEIKLEVMNGNEKEMKEISNYEVRIKNLLEISDKKFVLAYNESNRRHRFKRPLAFIENRSCDQCRMQLDAMTISATEGGHSVELCTGCGRLLTPFGARS